MPKLNFCPQGNQGWCIQNSGPPQIRVCSVCLKPHHQTEINRIEKVQRTAACWACRRWRNQSHVGEMLEELQWP